MSSSTTPRQHDYNGSTLPQLPEPTHAERARTLFSLALAGTLSTVSRRHAGYPFGSLMPYALDDTGCAILLISNMAMHTQNLKVNPRASLFVGQVCGESDPLGAARATLVGRAEAIPPDKLASVRERYLARHENSRYWVDFADFTFYCLEPAELYYVGGFGVMGWVDAAEYAEASPDPLAAAAPGILTHMNADHEDSMILLARRHAQIEASGAAMTAVDRLGFSLRLKTADGVKGARINFLREVKTPQETRMVLVEMVNKARAEG